MSNNQKNYTIVEKLFTLFSDLAKRTITKDQKKELEKQLNLLKTSGNITDGEYNIMFDMLNKITSAESRQQIEKNLPAMNNAKKAAREQQLAQTLDMDEKNYLLNILLKLQGAPLTQIIRSKEISGIFPNDQSFQDFIMTKPYHAHHIIGEGSFGKVFQLDISGSSFVLKAMLLPDISFFISVKNEIEALQQVIGKWYAVQLLASAILIDENLTLGRLGVAYILYPFIPGETLAVYQETEHSEEEEKAIYSYIIEAVQQLHIDTGLLHSDIKPENIWIPTDRDIRPFLLDFGLVQSLQNEKARNEGTPFYWSEKREKQFRSKGKSEQKMTRGINWLATAITLSSEVRGNNARELLPLRKRFKTLYRETNENRITKNDMNRALHGSINQNRNNHGTRRKRNNQNRNNQNQNNQNQNQNRNRNRNNQNQSRNTKRRKQ